MSKAAESAAAAAPAASSCDDQPSSSPSQPQPQPPILMVSSNRKKVQRAHEILSPTGRSVHAVSHLHLTEIQSDSIVAVAEDKARQAWAALGGATPCIVADYGLEIACLKGFPGPYTDYVKRTLGCEGLIRLTTATLRDASGGDGDDGRACCWNMCVVYTTAEGVAHTFTAPVEGRVPAEMAPGAASDNLLYAFVPKGHERCLGEMSKEEYAAYFAQTECVYHLLAEFLGGGGEKASEDEEGRAGGEKEK
eukprot:Rhum_TRINITY_DN9456_c0_g1::Rhum_TRINITY_DN9456_c0_g1_i1::g.33385::m.33385/K02428/rdgB; XTP/dITP diphosphohydrolase